MQANWGFTKLAEYTKDESFDEMRHPSGSPSASCSWRACRTINSCSRCGSGKPSKNSWMRIWPSSEKSWSGYVPNSRCAGTKAITTTNLFEDILASEEDHIDYLETNLELIDKLGEQLYLSQLVQRPPPPADRPRRDHPGYFAR
jgi:bacterioferritin